MEHGRTDEALMLAYRDGDAAAFEALYRRWRVRLFRYLQHQCGDKAVSEELYQDVWLKIINARANYQVTAKFATWMFRVARNRLIDHWRASGRRGAEMLASYDEDVDADDPPALAGLAASPDEAPERLLERRHLAQRLLEAVSALPAAQRETFLLAEEGDLTLEEIAAVTGTKRETAKSRLRYAHARLREQLKEWWP